MGFAPHYIVYMAEELDLDTLDSELERENRVEKRIKDLSEKVRLTSEGQEKERLARTEVEGKLAEAQRERDFFAGFADVVSTNPAAKDHKDDILAKVKGGYSVEDATYAVLGKAGKLGNQPEPRQIVDSPVGGSAVTQPPTAKKAPNDLSQQERRAQLLEAEARGDLSMR